MKKEILFAVMLLMFFTANAQNQNNKNPYENRNEIKVNLLMHLFGTFEGVYERSLNKKSSLGLSILYGYNEKLNEDVNYFITPYYRRYFGKKYTSGFFVEGFGMLSSIDGKQIADINGNLTLKEEPDVVDFSLGLGMGSKWVTKSGFMFEVNVGLGRLLFNAKETDHDSVYRFGLNIGYRF